MTDDEKAKRLLSGKYCGNCIYSQRDLDEGCILSLKQIEEYSYCEKWSDKDFIGGGGGGTVSLSFDKKTQIFSGIQVTGVGGAGGSSGVGASGHASEDPFNMTIHLDFNKK